MVSMMKIPAKLNVFRFFGWSVFFVFSLYVTNYAIVGALLFRNKQSVEDAEVLLHVGVCDSGFDAPVYQEVLINKSEANVIKNAFSELATSHKSFECANPIDSDNDANLKIEGEMLQAFINMKLLKSAVRIFRNKPDNMSDFQMTVLPSNLNFETKNAASCGCIDADDNPSNSDSSSKTPTGQNSVCVQAPQPGTPMNTNPGSGSLNNVGDGGDGSEPPRENGRLGGCANSAISGALKKKHLGDRKGRNVCVDPHGDSNTARSPKQMLDQSVTSSADCKLCDDVLGEYPLRRSDETSVSAISPHRDSRPVQKFCNERDCPFPTPALPTHVPTASESDLSAQDIEESVFVATHAHADPGRPFSQPSEVERTQSSPNSSEEVQDRFALPASIHPLVSQASESNHYAQDMEEHLSMELEGEVDLRLRQLSSEIDRSRSFSNSSEEAEELVSIRSNENLDSGQFQSPFPPWESHQAEQSLDHGTAFLSQC